MSLFTNGFEEGDFSAYTATEGNPTVTTSPLHHGTYAMQAILQAETAPVYCRANKNITSTPAVYMRCYARMEDLFTGSGIKGIGPRLYYSTGTTLAYVIVDCPGNKWGIRNVVNSTNYYESTTSTINPDQWYCLELYMSASSTNGELKLWVDGTLKVNQTGINTGSNNITGASVNSYSQNAEPYARTLYFDCAVVDDSYIGTEGGGTASKLAYTAGAAQTVTVGSVSSVITVQVQDQSGNPVTTGATVSLSSSSAGGSFYSDSAGTNQITSRVIPSGQSSTSYYYKDTNTGNPILTASATGLTQATTTFSINSSGQLTHNDITDWSTATSPFLRTVTPTNLSGSGFIRSDWTVHGSQVSGDISGNATSITGTIPWTKITGAPSFVTSGSSVTFSGLTIVEQCQSR